MNKTLTTIDEIMHPGESARSEIDSLKAAMARIDEELTCFVAPASYKHLPPFKVGHKGGYATWMAAVDAGKASDHPVIDAAGVCIWAPRGMR